MNLSIEDLPYRPCVGIMLVNKDGEVFTGMRVDSPSPAWQMPQGGIDKGETPLEAAVRELMEETGVSASKVTIEAETKDWVTYDLPHELIGKLWKGKYRGQKQKWFLMRFHGEDADIDITVEPREFSEWRWYKADGLVAQIVPFKQHVYEAVVSEFSEKIIPRGSES